MLPIVIKDKSGLDHMTTELMVKSGTIVVEKNEEQIDINNLNISNAPGNAMSAAMVEGVAKYMEVILQDFISAGVTNIMESMGINQLTMDIAKTFVNVLDNGLTLMSTIIKAVPSNIYMIPSGSSCTDILSTSFRDMFDAMWLSLLELYYTEWNNCITNLPSLQEIQKDLAEMALNAMLEIADQYCFKYTGYHIMELYYMVKHYIDLFKAYRAAKKFAKENGYNMEVSAGVTVDADAIKKLLMQELNEMSDMLYNSFIVLLIKDVIEQVKDMIALFHDADLTTLTDGMENFSDVMDLLTEMGLDDDSSMVLSLSETIKSSINQFQNNAMQLLGQMGALTMLSGIDMMNTTMNSVDVNVNVNIYQMYKFEADTENHALNMYIYADPTTNAFKKSLNSTLSVKDEDGNQYMSNANILSLLNTVIDGYKLEEEKKIDIKGTTYVIKYDIKNEVKPEEKKEEEPKENPTPMLDLGVVKEDFTEDPLAKRKRPTIALVHELFVLLKQVFPILNVLVHLILNYKINKEKVKNHALGNLWALARLVAAAKKLTNKINTTNTNFYTVRTLLFYDYISHNITDPGTSPTLNLDKSQTLTIWKYLQEHKQSTESVKRGLPTLLYIDNESINALRNKMKEDNDNLGNYFEDTSLFLKYPETKYDDGDTLGLDKVEYIGNEVYYSDSSLPMYGSQIWIAYSKS